MINALRQKKSMSTTKTQKKKFSQKDQTCQITIYGLNRKKDKR